MDERRKTRRYPIAYPVESRTGGASHTLTMVDVSKGGLAFTGSSDVKENDTVDIDVFLQKRRFSLKAMVVYAKKLTENIYNVGAKFLDTPDDFIDTLEKEIEQITQYHRESNLYLHKNMSFKCASEEFLKNPPLLDE